MPWLALIPKWTLVALTGALLVLSGLLQLQTSSLKVKLAAAELETQEVRVKHADMARVQTEDLIKSNTALQAKEREIRVAQDETRKAKNEQTAINTKLRDALRLRYLPETADASSASSTQSADSIALIGQITGGGDNSKLSDSIRGRIEEASRAEEIRVNLLYCYSSYDTAKKMLEDAAKIK